MGMEEDSTGIFLALVRKYSEKPQDIWSGLEPGFLRNKRQLCFANRLGIQMIHRINQLYMLLTPC
jgi:hypothetical protein